MSVGSLIISLIAYILNSPTWIVGVGFFSCFLWLFHAYMEMREVNN